MIELQQNRYLWVHFAGLAFVPLLLDICLAGLASAGPALPFGGQFWAIALLGIIPALAMQWLKPFYVFSLPPSALKPSVLSEDQRRCLQIFKSWQIKALAVVVAIFSLWLLVQMYAMSVRISPLLTPRAGLICAAIAFFIASSFMQISVSAGRALLIGPSALKRVAVVEESAIARDFLILGFRLDKLLPEVLPANLEDDVVQKANISQKEITKQTTAKQEIIEQESIETEISLSQDPISQKDVADDSSGVAEELVLEKKPAVEEREKELLAKSDDTEEIESPDDRESLSEAETNDLSPKTSVVKTSELKEKVDEDEEPEIIYPERLPPEGDTNS